MQRLLTRKEATFELAQRLRAGGIPLGEAFTFLSGLYFRGKTTYATEFGKAPRGLFAQYVITSSDGLLAADAVVDLQTLKQFSRGSNRTYGIPVPAATGRKYSRT